MIITQRHTVTDSKLEQYRAQNVAARSSSESYGTGSDTIVFECSKCHCKWKANRKEYTIVKRYKSGSKDKRDVSCSCPECFTINTKVNVDANFGQTRSLDDITGSTGKTYTFAVAVIGKVPLNNFNSDGVLNSGYTIKYAKKPYSVMKVETSEYKWYAVWNAINASFIRGTVLAFYDQYSADHKTKKNGSKYRVKTVNGSETLSSNTGFVTWTWNTTDAPLPSGIST